MNTPIFRIVSLRDMAAATLAFAAALVALASPAPVNAQTPSSAPAVVTPAPAQESLSWTFAAGQAGADSGWTAERGTLTTVNGEARLQPDANRRVVLLSPPGLPDAAGKAEAFDIGVTGTGLQRVRIQARRDARGGWITIADAGGNALREVPGGYAIKRNAGARDARIERLRIELEFRTTNPRTLQHIVVR